MICHYCRQPLAKHEAHDLRVMRPVHKACHVARLAEAPSLHLRIPTMPLPPSVARTLPRWGRGAMIVHLPIATVSESNRRDYWWVRAKRAKAQRQMAAMLVPGCPLPCVVTLTRISPRMLDDDNLQSALKAVRDGVADRLGVDDRDPRVEWRYAQRKGAQKGVEVEMEGIVCES